jgi:hypothetical protein
VLGLILVKEAAAAPRQMAFHPDRAAGSGRLAA